MTSNQILAFVIIMLGVTLLTIGIVFTLVVDGHIVNCDSWITRNQTNYCEDGASGWRLALE